MSVHAAAVEGFVEGDMYDKFRPSYTDGAVEHVLDITGLDTPQDPDTIVLELGAGTGKFTRRILPKIHKSVTYIATDQSDSFIDTLKASCPGAKTEVCSAANIPLGDSSIKVLFGAQCYHWFANEESLKEMHRVLVPGGKVVFVWNIKDREVGWVKKVEEIVHEYYTEGIPTAYGRVWKEVTDNSELFHTKVDKFLPGYRMEGSVDDILNHFSTISVIAKLDEEEKRSMRSRMRNIIENAEENEGKSTVVLPFVTEVFHFQK